MSTAAALAALPMAKGPSMVGYLVQAVQSLDGAVFLVAGRDAYLRVFPTSDGSNTAFPQLYVSVDGGALVPMTIPTGTNVPTDLYERTTATNAWAKIDKSLVRTGMVVQVFGYGPTLTIKPTVRESIGAQMLLIPMNPLVDGQRIVGTTVGTPSDPNWAQINQRCEKAKWTWPIRDLNISVRAAFNSASISAAGNDVYLLWAASNTFDTFYVGVIAGVPNEYRAAARLGGFFMEVGEKNQTVTEYDAFTLPHEFGHNMSNGHFGCDYAPVGGMLYARQQDGTFDGTFPECGWDYNALPLGVDPVVPSRYAVDVMSYCFPKSFNNQRVYGVSSYGWEQAWSWSQRQSGLNLQYAPPVVVTPMRVMLFTIPDDQHAHLSGVMDAADGTASKDGAWTLSIEEQNGSVHRFHADDAELSHTYNRYLGLRVPTDIADRAIRSELRDPTGLVRWTQLAGPSVPLHDGERTTAPEVAAGGVSWDPREFDGAVVRDRETKEALGHVRESGSLEDIAPDRPLEVTMHRGLTASDPIRVR